MGFGPFVCGAFPALRLHPPPRLSVGTCQSAIENDRCPGKNSYFSDATKQWMINLRVGDLDKMAVIRRTCIAGTECLKLK
jgi:hypothetical protein